MFDVEIAFTVLLSVLKSTVKNKKKKAELKRAMLKLRNQINLIYGNDPDFQ